MNIPAFPIIPPFLRGVRGDRKGSPLSEITLDKVGIAHPTGLIIVTDFSVVSSG
ncbi:hypothetical protein CWATWH8502_1952 [Crocosphaera watsonii WH 8502]|uniref:Uncharacterized protein n=1 Tax=Crocosphaera watsonii WH 8502 TaxID=423474 RepID=T2IBB6_CROWT|nr:hypothetical protein CWATWH8502_1952 [Crocosphaera watsonii WH 8502]